MVEHGIPWDGVNRNTHGVLVDDDLRRGFLVAAKHSGRNDAPAHVSRAHFAHSLLTRDLRSRDDIHELFEQEIRAGIDTLDEDTQKQVWSLLATA